MIISKNIFFLYAAIIFFGSVLLIDTAEAQQRVKPSSQTPDTREETVFDTTGTAAADSLKYDIGDSVLVDTTGVSPLFEHGSVTLLPYSFYRVVDKNDIQFTNYVSLIDILYKFTNGYPLNLGAYGQFNNVSLFGGMPTGSTTLFNTRPLNDPRYMSFNVDQFPVEFFEEMEILTGSDAAILAGSQSGQAINFKERRYNSRIPYTHLWFGQSGGDFISGDGVYSKNLRDDLNLNIGFRTMFSDGDYRNQWLESWNVRGLLRWNPDSLTSISFTENFYNHKYGNNGGLHPELSRSQGSIDYDPIDAVEMYTGDMNERNVRHDATLSFSRYLASDSSSAISADLFYTHSIGYRSVNDKITADQYYLDSITRFLDYFAGANAKYEQELGDNLTFRAGGEAYYVFVEGYIYNPESTYLNFAGFGHLEIKLDTLINLAGGARINHLYGNSSLAFGGRLRYKMSDKFTLVGDLSLFERTPSIMEGLNLDNEATLLAFSEVQWTDGKNIAYFNAFYRRIESPILSYPVYDDEQYITAVNTINDESATHIGGSIEFKLELFENIYFNAELQGYFSSKNNEPEKYYPLVNSDFDVSYHYKISRSLLIVGTSISFLTGKEGYGFFPLKRVFTENEYSSPFSFNGLNAYASARLGNAFVRVGFYNLLSTGYHYVAIYPMYQRNFRLSFGWSFFD